jgi:ABC-type amino acid transport system permease subunit
MANQHIQQLQAAIKATREKLVEHPLYSQLQTIEQIQLFTSYHVFAVWDFMSLLKALQQNLTCTTTPWVPVGSANTRYLINEIVLGEESDVDEKGNRTSHFELYLKAMQQLGADTTVIEQLLVYISNGVGVIDAMDKLQLPEAIKAFVNFTFDIVSNQPAHVQAAVFTFGREDLIPDMFIGLVSDLSASHPEQISILKYYLERHIEVDGDHHSHLAMEMVADLCGNDATKWQQATEDSILALQKRQLLWNAISFKLNDMLIMA